MFIDPHVHCRDGTESHKETIVHALKVAKLAGFTAIFDMPNTVPPLIAREDVVKRLEIARQCNSSVWYGVYMALTADKEQIKRAVETYSELERVVGFKLYAALCGNLGVVDTQSQREVYQTLAREKYKGVIAVHCEKESMLNNVWDPDKAISFALARPWQAEVESVKEHILFAKEAGFEGTLHIAHISVPKAVEVVNKETSVCVTCGVTPHHLLFDYNAMLKYGLLMKMNPPLRPLGMNNELLEMLRTGMISWIETDHAPHTLEEKLQPPYLSGIPGLQKYPKFIAWLRDNGFSEELINTITYTNIVDSFGLQLQQRQCLPQLNLEHEYPFDPYKGKL